MPTMKNIVLKVLDDTLELSETIYEGEDVTLTVDFTGCEVDLWAKWIDVRLYDGTGAPISLGTDIICSTVLSEAFTQRGRIEVQPYAISGTDTIKYPVKQVMVKRSLQVTEDNVVYDPSTLSTMQTTVSNLQISNDLLEAEDVRLDTVKSDVGHTHDDRYYTESEADALLAGKANSVHTHDERYYTEGEIDGLLDARVLKVPGSVLIPQAQLTDLTDGNDSTAHYHATDRNTDNHVSGSTNKVYTALEQTKLAGIETGAEVNNISDVNATDLTDGGETTLHIHDSRYYTETELNNGQLDTRYYTETEADTLLGNKADKLFATNLVTNGDFSNGTTGWTGVNTNLSPASNTLTGTGTGGGSNLLITQSYAFVNGRKYYLKTRVRTLSSVSTQLSFGSNLVNLFQVTPVQNQWYAWSSILSATTDNSFRFINSYATAAAQNGQQMEVQYVLAIDLTAIFGAGKEPSAIQMDNMLSTFTNSWFNGTAELVSIANLAQLKADKTQGAWITPTLINGWVESLFSVRYRKDAFGIVRLRGRINGGTNGTVAFILPVGYRPTQAAGMLGMSDVNVVPRITINSDGTVTINNFTSYMYLDGISFSTN